MSKKLLTTQELKVMNLLWKMKKAFVREMVESWEGKTKPAYNTISTYVRILEDKGFVGHESFGRSHQYFPLISKTAYQKRLVKNVLKTAFSGSVEMMLSTLVKNEDLSDKEIEGLKKIIDENK